MATMAAENQVTEVSSPLSGRAHGSDHGLARLYFKMCASARGRIHRI